MKKKYFKRLMMLVVLSTFSISIFAQVGNADKLKAKIVKMNDKMVKAIQEDDHETLSAMYTEDVYSLPSYSPMVMGKEKMIEIAMKDKEAGFKMMKMKFDVVDVIPAGNYAIEIGNYDVTMKIPMMDEPMDDKGKYVTVWEIMKDGSMKIKVETWNTDMNPWMGEEMMGKGEQMQHEEHKK
ncbi:MAG: nuclear transport factor 2 family protein [Bacteroidales bacterium]|nr:nuclear transport factor 2 family protein [Bacteroidales bacterium]